MLLLLLLSSLFLLLLLRCLILSIADPAWQAGSSSDCNCEVFSGTSRLGILQRSRFFRNQKLDWLTQFLSFLKIPLATHLRQFQHTIFIRKQLLKSPPGWYAQWVQIQMEDGEQYRCPINAWIFHGLVGKKWWEWIQILSTTVVLRGKVHRIRQFDKLWLFFYNTFYHELKNLKSVMKFLLADSLTFSLLTGSVFLL